MKKDNIRIARIHICTIEKADGNNIKLDLQNYPERLCVIDEENSIVIDVETKHQYPYIRTVNRLYFASEDDVARIKYGKRNAYFDYSNFLMLDFSLSELNRCKEIIEQLKQGVVFIDGNEALTNEEYLNMIKNSKKENPPKKKCKKRN